MLHLQARVTNFLKREDGPTAVEYAVMLALIIGVVTASVSALGGNAAGVFGSVFSSSSGLGGFAGSTFTDQYGATMAFNSDGTATMDSGVATRTFTPTGPNTYSYSDSNGQSGTMTVNGNGTMSVQDQFGSYTYTKNN